MHSAMSFEYKQYRLSPPLRRQKQVLVVPHVEQNAFSMDGLPLFCPVPPDGGNDKDGFAAGRANGVKLVPKDGAEGAEEEEAKEEDEEEIDEAEAEEEADDGDSEGLFAVANGEVSILGRTFAKMEESSLKGLAKALSLFESWGEESGVCRRGPAGRCRLNGDAESCADMVGALLYRLPEAISIHK